MKADDIEKWKIPLKTKMTKLSVADKILPLTIKILFNGCRGLKLYLKCPVDENVKLSALISKRGGRAFPEEIIPPLT